MRSRGSESGMIKQWFEKMDASDPGTRKKVINHQDLSTRFRMRLWTETLPTYKVINTRASEGSADAHIYGTLLEEGKCRCCGSGDIETIDHILTECPNPKLKELRTQAKLEVEKMWAGQGEMQAWSLHDWITPGPADASHGVGWEIRQAEPAEDRNDGDGSGDTEVWSPAKPPEPSEVTCGTARTAA